MGSTHLLTSHFLSDGMWAASSGPIAAPDAAGPPAVGQPAPVPFRRSCDFFSYHHCFATKMTSEFQSIFSTETPATKNPKPIFDFKRLVLLMAPPEETVTVFV